MVLVSKPKRQTSVHHKRRQGGHHQRSGPYLKTYWPYLPLTLVVAAGLLLSSAWGVVQHQVLSYATNVSIAGLLDGTNVQRANNGLGGLAVNQTLNQAAQAKANDMVTRDYWSHNTPEGNPPWVFFTNAGYDYETAGENLAYGFDSSDATITAWMNSPGHKANILNTTYQEVGFGFANGSNYQGTGPETVVVAMYAKPYKAAASNPAPAAPKPAVQSTQPAAPVQETPAAPEETQPEESEAELNTTPVVTKDDKPSAKPVDSTGVSRIQLITNGQAPWSLFAVSFIATVAAAVFFFRHGLFWHRFLIKGERFIIKHRVLDFVLVGVCILGYILSRTVGFIR